MPRREWSAWAGEEPTAGRVRLGVQQEVPAVAGWARPVLVWETWSLEGVREEVARAGTTGGGRLPAVGGTPATVKSSRWPARGKPRLVAPTPAS